MNLEWFADTLQVDRSSDGVLRLTKVNANSAYGISMKMLEALQTVFDTLQDDESIRAVVIDAEGEAMQNGAVMVQEIKPSLAELTREDFARVVSLGQTLGRAIASAPVPVIGIARGGALGGGLELLLRSDFAFCTDRAQFSFPEVTAGFVAAWGGTQWGGRYMTFRKAQELLLTGLPIDGTLAEEYGLVTRSFTDSADLDQHVDELLNHLRHCSPASLRWTKHCLAAIWDGSVGDVEAVDVAAEVETMSSRDYLNGVDALVQGRLFDFVDDEMGERR